MVEKENIIKEKIKYGGLGDFKETYKYAYFWFEDQGFTLTEDTYSEKISGNAKEIEIEWTCSKKVTDYFKIKLSVRWHILAMTEVEVEIAGKKKNMNKFGELKIEIKGTLEKDYSNKWESSAFNKFLREIYQKYVIPQRTEQKEGDVAEVVQDFKENIKAFLELTGRKK